MKQLLGLFLLMVSVASAAETNLFPFVLPWDDASPGITDRSAASDSPAGAHGFVVARNGHLYAGDQRIRFFGVNICFSGCFPEHADAEKIAARMAKFGINCVRFHHMDTSVAPRGILQPDKRTLDPVQLDRLDYFIAQIKKHGIYANLNLHVGRVYPGQPAWKEMPKYHKGVDNFFPAMIELQREYARDLLTHLNPYTKTRYADEPAVAFIEINNENGLIHEWQGGDLDDMPAAVAGEFGRQWNGWLARRYSNDVALRRAWNVQEQPLGAEMLDPRRWSLEQHEGAKASLSTTNGVLTLHTTHPGKESWHVQFRQTGLRIQRGQGYTVSFRAKADRPKSVSVGLTQADKPWHSFARINLSLTGDWQTFTVSVAPNADESNARLIFSGFGDATGSVQLADISLKPGGVFGLRPGEKLGAMTPFRKAEFSARTAEAQRDWIRFLWDTEVAYWTGMSRYLKNDLKARGLVVGTQVNFSPSLVQAELDVVDSHSYWQHPRFPGKPWDPNNWLIKNTPMSAEPDGGVLSWLTAARVPGKPYICTEYNHPAPNVYNSEAFLMLAATAAREDWDGVFAFTYSHSNDDWNARKITSYFNIDQHPTQMATFPAASAFFRSSLVPVAPTPLSRPDTATMQEKLRTAGIRSLYTPAKWEHTNGVFTVTAPRAKAVVGFTRGRAFDLGNGVRITPGTTRQDWSAISVTEMTPGHWLITATGYAENTGMGWKNAEKTTVGRDWGSAPSLVEGIPAAITLPRAKKAWALDERGQRKAELPVRNSLIEISPQQRTLWYEVSVQ